MKIDGCLVVPGSAESFRAIGGGYGIRMKLPKGRGDFLFGIVPAKETAETIVKRLNGSRAESDIASSTIRTRVKMDDLQV